MQTVVWVPPVGRYNLLSLVNSAAKFDELTLFFYSLLFFYTLLFYSVGESITIDFYSLMNFISVFLHNLCKREKSQIIAQNYGEFSNLIVSFVLTSEILKSVCWTSLLLMVLLGKHSCWKQTDCCFDHFLCENQTVMTCRLCFLLMREAWTHSSRCGRGDWIQPLCVVSSSSDPAVIILQGEQFTKSSEHELYFSETSKPFQLGEALRC